MYFVKRILRQLLKNARSLSLVYKRWRTEKSKIYVGRSSAHLPSCALHNRYWPGSRVSWVKLKQDFIAGLGDTVDLLVFGGDYNMPGRSKQGG